MVRSFDMPESLIFSSVHGRPLSRFVPEVYFLESTAEALQYVVEDVDGQTPQDGQLVTVAGALPALHMALLEWAEIVQPRLATRHQHYFVEIAPTMQVILKELAVESANQSAAELLDGWQRVVELQSALDVGDGRQPIHGDLHRWNVLFAETSGGTVKIIDWDSVVWGHPLVDLATLLIDESAELQASALDAYLAGRSPGDDLAADERLYLHARLHVSLLWSCLFASGRGWSRRASVMDRHLDEAARLLAALI
ncbi:MAG: aminoglycoside phosphotransferase family protein [Acidimicrobiia bacterium]|nr:aminoglycoside phosphotransferase family protein [Acidimicrobiia bacterium]